MEWIPIPSSGGNLGMLGLVPKTRGRAKPSKRLFAAPAPTAPIEDTRVSSQEIAVTLAANLGLGGIFGGTVGFNEVGYWLDAMAYTDRFEEEPADGNLVLATRFGFGLRVMFRVTKLNTKVSLSYGMIGAAVDVGYANASYEIDAFGLGAGALPVILRGIGQFGTLNSDTFYKLNTVVLKNLVEYIKANISTLQPHRVAALVRSVRTGDSLDVSQPVLFAMRRIRSGRSLRDALADAGDLDSASIRLVYSNVLGDVPDTTEPRDRDEQKADEWLRDD